MKKWCLIKEKADRLIKKISSGDISPEKMNNMSSKERRAFFASFLGEEDAFRVNTDFEKKLLNKNQEQGMISWVQETTGKNSELKAELLAKVEKNRQDKLKRIFSPEEDELFLSDLVETKLGLGITEEESKTLFNLSKKFQENKDLFNKNSIYDKLSEIKGDITGNDKKVVDSLIERLEGIKEGKAINSKVLATIKRQIGEGASDDIKKKVGKLVDDIIVSRKDRSLAYGRAKVALEDYIGDIKLGIKSKKTFGSVLQSVGDFSKSTLAAVDNSFIGRQGIKTLYSGNPMVWLKSMGESFKVLAKAGILGEDALKGVKAEIFSRLNSRNGIYDKMKLDIGTLEEAFPTSLPEKIPLLGRLFSASNQAFSASAFRMRADLADLMIKKAQKQGVDLTNKLEAESLGKLINSMTGRGKINFLSESGQRGINSALFSPKFLKSSFDILTAHFFDKEMSTFAKKEAGKNLVSIISSISGILYLADKLQPGSVEWDPRSSDFGKIRIGNTRFDVTGGMSSFVTLVARVIGGSKSSTTGKLTKTGEYGSKDVVGLSADFVANKAAPVARTIMNILRKEDFDRNPLTLEAMKNDPMSVAWSIGKGLAVPLPIQNSVEAYQNKDAEPAVAAIIADFMGVSANIYTPGENWAGKQTVEIKDLKDKIGYKKTMEINKEFNSRINFKILELKKREEFMALDPSGKIKVIDKVKSNIKAELFEEAGYEKEKEKTTKEEQALSKKIIELAK